MSYNEIRKEIKVSKSTLSVWLKHVELSKNHRDRLYTKQIKILSLGPKSQRERRSREIEKIISLAESEITLPLSYDAYRFLGAALYWAEGSKNKMFEMTNSDPYSFYFSLVG